MSTPSIRKLIEEQGGTVRDTADGIAYEPPTAPKADAKEIEAAVERAKEYGTVVMPVWRERGDGWYVADSHADHPGYWYLLQIDEHTGQPVKCECVAAQACHHLGAAIRRWRERVGWAQNEEDVLSPWRETLARVQANRPHRMAEEQWT